MAGCNSGFDLRRQTAIVCLALAVFASTLIAVHAHPQSEQGPNAKHCLICVAAHSPTVPVTTVLPAADTCRAHGTVPLGTIEPQSRLVSTDLFTRPPPAV